MNGVARFGAFTQEESLNHSLPTLPRKHINFSSLAEMKPKVKINDGKLESLNSRFKVLSPSFTDNDQLYSPVKVNPHKRLPLVSPGKKNFHIISKSKSVPDILPNGLENHVESLKIPVHLATEPNQSNEKKTQPGMNETFSEYYFQSMPGFSDGKVKTNQDAYYINICIKGSTLCSLFAVFDGHGPLGHKVSEFLKRNLTGSDLITRIYRKPVRSRRGLPAR